MKVGTLNRGFKFPSHDAPVKTNSSHLKAPRRAHKRAKSASDIPVIRVTQAGANEAGDSVAIQQEVQNETTARRNSDVHGHRRPVIQETPSFIRESAIQAEPERASASSAVTTAQASSFNASHDSASATFVDTSSPFSSGLSISNSSRKKSITSEHSSDRDPFYYDRERDRYLWRSPSAQNANTRNEITGFLRPRALSGASSRSAVYQLSSHSSSAYPSIGFMARLAAPSFRPSHSRQLSDSSKGSLSKDENLLSPQVEFADNLQGSPSLPQGHFRRTSLIDRWFSGQSSVPFSPGHSRTHSAVSASSVPDSETMESSLGENTSLLNAFLHPSGTRAILPSTGSLRIPSPHQSTAANAISNVQTSRYDFSLFPSIRENPQIAIIQRNLQESLARRNEEQRKLLESSKSSVHSSVPSSVFDDNASLSSIMTRRTGGIHSQSSSLASSGVWPVDAPIRRRRDSFGNWSMSSGAHSLAEWMLGNH